MLAVFLQFRHDKLFRYKVLYIYYAGSAFLLYTGIAFFDNNTWTYNVLFFANILVTSWYYRTLFDNKIKRRITVLCGTFNLLLFIYINIIQGKYEHYNSYIYGVSFITIVLYSLLYLHQLMIGEKEESLLLKFDFWLICGYLLYFLGSFIIVLYYDETAYKSERGNMWLMHNIILFICSVITLVVSLQISKKNNQDDI